MKAMGYTPKCQNAYLRRQDYEKPMDLGACLYWANLNSNRKMLLFYGVPR